MSNDNPQPIGLLPAQIRALREAAGVSEEDFGNGFGVSANVVGEWESLGVPSGPTALAIRFVADTMQFELTDPAAQTDPPCVVCGGPAADTYTSVAICGPCFRDPVKSLEARGYTFEQTTNPIARQADYVVHLPAGRAFAFRGRFVSEGLGTMLTKLFKEEPQLGEKQWDDAVYVQWVDPDLDAIGDGVSRELIRKLVVLGLVEVVSDAIHVQHVPSYGGATERVVVLLASIFAARESS